MICRGEVDFYAFFFLLLRKLLCICANDWSVLNPAGLLAVPFPLRESSPS